MVVCTNMSPCWSQADTPQQPPTDPGLGARCMYYLAVLSAAEAQCPAAPLMSTYTLSDPQPTSTRLQPMTSTSAPSQQQQQRPPRCYNPKALHERSMAASRYNMTRFHRVARCCANQEVDKCCGIEKYGRSRGTRACQLKTRCQPLASARALIT